MINLLLDIAAIIVIIAASIAYLVSPNANNFVGALICIIQAVFVLLFPSGEQE
jgi:hypothetical protein